MPLSHICLSRHCYSSDHLALFLPCLHTVRCCVLHCRFTRWPNDALHTVRCVLHCRFTRWPNDALHTLRCCVLHCRFTRWPNSTLHTVRCVLHCRFTRWPNDALHTVAKSFLTHLSSSHDDGKGRCVVLDCVGQHVYTLRLDQINSCTWPSPFLPILAAAMTMARAGALCLTVQVNMFAHCV